MKLTTIRFNDHLTMEEGQSFFLPGQWVPYEEDSAWWQLRLLTRIN